MKYATTLGWAIGALIAAQACLSPAEARVWPVADSNVDLVEMINTGLKKGTITKEQAIELKAEEGKIAEKAEKLKAERKGKLTEDDNKDLQKDAEKLHEKILNLEATKADNSKKNLGDARDSSVLPTDQSEKKGDLAITQNIRKSLVNDKNLSFNAKNVKIVTVDGTVTLRGVVDSDAEKDKIGAVAKETLGSDKVVNELTIVQK